MKISWLKITALAAMLAAPIAHAKVSQWSLGVAASYSPAVYKDTDSNRTVIPLVGYEGAHIFFRGFSAGYRLNPIGSPQNIIFRLGYDPRTLKPEDSNNANIQLMDEREATVLGGVTYQMVTMAGIFEVGAGSDIGGTHNGLYAEAAWRLPIRMKGWGITPAIGYSYNGEKLNNHLYGVSASEAARSGFDEFDADWDGQYFIGLSTYFNLAKNVRVNGGIRYTNLEGDIEKSPLIESGINTVATVGIAYVF